MRKPKRGVLWFGGVVLAVFLVLQFLPPDRSLWNAILDSQRVELFSLDPDADSAEDGGPPPGPHIQAWHILGQAVVDTEERMALVHALERPAHMAGCGCIVGVPSCFNPRHALRYTHDGTTYDAIICFECQQMVVYADGKEKIYRSLSPDGNELFNRALKRHNIALAPPPGRGPPPHNGSPQSSPARSTPIHQDMASPINVPGTE